MEVLIRQPCFLPYPAIYSLVNSNVNFARLVGIEAVN